MTPRAQVVTLAIGAVVAVAMAAVTARSLPVPPPANDVVQVLFAGGVAVVAGVLVGRWRAGRRTAWQLVAMGLITMLTLLAFSNRALPFTLGGLLAGTQIAVALHLLLCLPDGELETGSTGCSSRSCTPSPSRPSGCPTCSSTAPTRSALAAQETCC